MVEPLILKETRKYYRIADLPESGRISVNKLRGKRIWESFVRLSKTLAAKKNANCERLLTRNSALFSGYSCFPENSWKAFSRCKLRTRWIHLLLYARAADNTIMPLASSASDSCDFASCYVTSLFVNTITIIFSSARYQLLSLLPLDYPDTNPMHLYFIIVVTKIESFLESGGKNIYIETIL